MEEMGFRVAASPSPPAMSGAEEETAEGGRRESMSEWTPEGCGGEKGEGDSRRAQQYAVGSAIAVAGVAWRAPAWALRCSANIYRGPGRNIGEPT